MKIDPEFFSFTKKIETPFFIYDIEQLKDNYRKTEKALPGVHIYYAVKCNPHDRFIKTLSEMGSGFEIASLAEAEKIIKAGVVPKHIVCFHPIKSPEFLQYLHKHHIDIMAADSYEEIDKIARFAPGSKIVPRVYVDNKDSGWNLSGKFGMPASEIPRFFDYIISKNLTPYGLTTHVGSQCQNNASWVAALDLYKEIWQEMEKRGVYLKLLSLGGGLPVHYRKPVADVAAIGKITMEHIAKSFPQAKDLVITIEPGRALAASTGVLVTSVFGTATRGDKLWAYIETGTYNGLVEAIETGDRQFYPLAVEHNERPVKRYNIGGPSCVSLDTPFEDVELPELVTGDRLFVLNAGAYLATCGAPFNGFPVPTEYLYEV